MTINELNTNYILDNISLQMLKIDDLQNVDYSPRGEQIIFDSLNTSTPLLSQNLMNFNDTVGYLQTADEALKNLSSVTSQLTQLNSELNDPNISEKTKQTLQQQEQSLQNNINNILKDTTYNNQPIFGNKIEVGDKSFDLGISTDDLDLSNPTKLKEFINAIKNTKNDIDIFLNNSTDNLNNLDFQDLGLNFDNNLDINNNLNYLNTINQDQLLENAYLIATAHNQDYLSQNIEQLLNVEI